VGNGCILAVGKGDDAFPADDDNGALRAVGVSNVPSSGSTTLVIGAIDADCSLDAGDVLATIGGGAIGAIYSGGGSVAIGDSGSVAIGGGGGNLNADALRVGGDENTVVLLGICTIVARTGDDHGVVATWHRPKCWQRRRR
jgi:hypothetical protein